VDSVKFIEKDKAYISVKTPADLQKVFFAKTNHKS